MKGVNEQDTISKEHLKNIRRKREKYVVKAKQESAKRNRQGILSVPVSFFTDENICLRNIPT